MAVATYSPGTQTAVATFGGSTDSTVNPVQGAPNTIQNTVPTSDQYLLANNTGSAGTGQVLGDSTTGPTAAQIAQQQAVNDWNNLVGGTNSVIQGNITNAGTQYQGGINDFLDQYKQGQTNIDRQEVQNELARQQGNAGVLDMVGHGLRSGGVLLDNNNASDSSATEALARAYGDIGRRQASHVGNQFANAENTNHNAQIDLDNSVGIENRKLGDSKASTVNNIVNTAVQALQSLNQSAAYASIPDRIDIEQRKQEIYNQTMGELQQYDALLGQGTSAAAPASRDSVAQQATALRTAGTAPASSFDFTSQVPAQFQNTGPVSSDLPIFTNQGTKKQTA